MPLNPDAVYDEELIGRIRRLEAKRAKIDREIYLLKQIRAQNEKRISPRRVRLRKFGLGRVPAHNRIVRLLEDHTKPVAAKTILAALHKIEPELKASTFRSHIKRLSDAGVLKQEGTRGCYVLIKREVPEAEVETSPKPYRPRPLV